MRRFWRKSRVFHARCIVDDDIGHQVVLEIGTADVSLRWPNLEPGQDIELMLDGAMSRSSPFFAVPPAQITFHEIHQWGPDSPPNILWRVLPERAPRVDHKRVVAIVTSDHDYRFLFGDETIAREADAALTKAIRAAGHGVADR